MDELLPDVPAPSLVSAMVEVGLAPWERIPLWAAHWLADGHDGDALRTLAGLSGRDSNEVHDVVAEALAECGAPLTGDLVAAVGVVFTEMARRYVLGADRAVLGVVGRVLYHSGFPAAVWEMPLAGLCTLLDDWDYEWGQPRDEIRVLVREACAAQLTV
ncbi:MAG: hypothetical protein ABIQ18_00575 [Umezawaea sp.]